LYNIYRQCIMHEMRVQTPTATEEPTQAVTKDPTPAEPPLSI
jgi:hypothetical protein